MLPYANIIISNQPHHIPYEGLTLVKHKPTPNMHIKVHSSPTAHSTYWIFHYKSKGRLWIKTPVPSYIYLLGPTISQFTIVLSAESIWWKIFHRVITQHSPSSINTPLTITQLTMRTLSDPLIESSNGYRVTNMHILCFPKITQHKWDSKTAYHHVSSNEWYRVLFQRNCLPFGSHVKTICGFPKLLHFKISPSILHLRFARFNSLPLNESWLILHCVLAFCSLIPHSVHCLTYGFIKPSLSTQSTK